MHLYFLASSHLLLVRLAAKVSTNKMWQDVSKAREARLALEKRLENASRGRQAKLRLVCIFMRMYHHSGSNHFLVGDPGPTHCVQRQEKARVENEHKQFVSETTAKINDANRVNEGLCSVSVWIIWWMDVSEWCYNFSQCGILDLLWCVVQ